MNEQQGMTLESHTAVVIDYGRALKEIQSLYGIIAQTQQANQVLAGKIETLQVKLELLRGSIEESEEDEQQARTTDVIIEDGYEINQSSFDKDVSVITKKEDQS